MVEELVLDKDVRNWVLIPLTVVMLMFTLLRQYASLVSGRCKGQAVERSQAP